MCFSSYYLSNELKTHQTEKISHKLTYLEASLLRAEMGLVRILYYWSVGEIASEIA